METSLNKPTQINWWYETYKKWLLENQARDSEQAGQQGRIFLNDDLGFKCMAAQNNQPLETGNEWWSRFLLESNLRERWEGFISEFGQCPMLILTK